jgi:hypothetical protein
MYVETNKGLTQIIAFRLFRSDVPFSVGQYSRQVEKIMYILYISKRSINILYIPRQAAVEC